MRFGLISDTHGRVHPSIHQLFSGVEAILHAGDVGDEAILDELELIAPVHAVAGNVDYTSARMPLKRIVELPFGKVGMAHGHEYPTDPPWRLEALLGTFRPNNVRMILYGHSHIARNEIEHGIHVVNPGAACPPRFKTTSSVCVMTWDAKQNVLAFETHRLEWKKP